VKKLDLMALEQYQDVTAAPSLNKFSFGNWKSLSAAEANSEDNPSGDFECNICLDSVHDPVVTLCGHLFCWPCIYKWLEVQGVSSETHEPLPQQCPVCKSEVSQDTLVPLYGRGRTTKPSKTKSQNLGIVIPKRPFGPACGFNSPRTMSPMSTPQSLLSSHMQNYQSSFVGSSPTIGMGGTAASIMDPVIGMLCEVVYARNPIPTQIASPNSYNFAGNGSPRVRRHVMEADRSLSRICFFLFCCIFLCLVLF
jgi:E3 ubiquitin-protein ligase RNF5